MKALGRAAWIGLVIACLVGCGGAATEGEAGADAGDDAVGGDAAAPAELVGSWTLVQLDGADLAAGDDAPTMMFGPDGTVAGTTGINRYSTTADMEQLAGGILALGPAVTTSREGAPEAMEVERKFLEHLANPLSFETDGVNLRLTSGDASLLVFESAAAGDAG